VTSSPRSYTHKGPKITPTAQSRTPTFFFIDKEGSVIGAQPGFIPKDTYKSLLTYVGGDIYNKMKFKEYLNQ
jgi:thioredoxin-related protein